MRRLFISLGKLLGLYEAYNALQHLAATLSMLSYLHRPIMGLTWEQLMPQIVGSLLFLVATAALSWLLLFRTERIADFLAIAQDDATPELTNDQLFRVGIKLLGLALLATAIPEAVRAFATAGSHGLWRGNYSIIWSKILPPMVGLVIAVIVTVRTCLIIDTLARWESLSGKRVATGGAFALLLLLLVSVVAAKVTGHWDPVEHYRSQSSGYQHNRESVVDQHPTPPAAPEFYTVTNVLSTTNTIDSGRFSNTQDVVEFLQTQYRPAVTTTSVPTAKTTIHLSTAPQYAY